MLNVAKLPPIIHPIEKIGVNLGVKTLATCSDGTTYEMPDATSSVSFSGVIVIRY
jgi:putative transposase